MHLFLHRIQLFKISFVCSCLKGRETYIRYSSMIETLQHDDLKVFQILFQIISVLFFRKLLSIVSCRGNTVLFKCTLSLERNDRARLPVSLEIARKSYSSWTLSSMLKYNDMTNNAKLEDTNKW